MNRDKSFPHRAKAYAFVAAAWLAIGAVGVFAAHGLSVESGQARTLVNQGQTELVRGDRVAAVLDFERARLLAPRSDLVRSALAATGAHEPAAPVDRAVSWVSPLEWFAMSVAFGWIAGVSLAVAIVRVRRRALARHLAWSSAVAFVLSMGGLLESSLASRALAVVTGPTGVFVAPYDAAGATADLHPGTVVVIGSRYGGFVEVRGPEDARGWVPSSVVQSVLGASI
jgi:hypothetical protein